MALVRISKMLLSDVEDGINTFASTVFTQTITPLHPEATSKEVVGGPLFDLAYGKLWLGKLHMKDTMPVEWMRTTERILVSVYGPDGNRVELRTYAPNKTIIHYMPRKTVYDSSTVMSVGLEYDDWKDIPWLQEFFAKQKIQAAAVKLHNEKFGTLKTQVKAFLEASKSLNDALKKYPDIKLWIPAPYLSEIDRVVVRVPKEVRVAKEATAAVAGIDTAMITALGVHRALQSV